MNKAHEALAAFSLQSTRDQLMPSNIGSTFTLITQNIDCLSQQALDRQISNENDHKQVSDPTKYNSSQPSQPPLYEMHGRIFEVVCSDEECGHIVFNAKSPLCPALAGTEEDVAGTQIEKEIALKDLPRCEKCNSLARPGVVWFGEAPRYMDEIDKLVENADLCLVVGTSSTVS
jgi:NAD+-dependent protein deacetylase sirtuin 5